jgi:hypothetical protein
MRLDNKNPGLVIVLVVGGVLAYFSTMGMIGGGGTVIDSASNQPVADAVVDLKCQNHALHGSYAIGEVKKVTDAKGKFFFSVFDTWRCDFAFVHAAKEGFIETGTLDIRYANSNFRSIPGKLHLTPLRDATLQSLRYHVAMSKGVYSDAAAGYLSLYGEFTSAEAIAKESSDVQFVRESFCDRLEDGYSRLSPEQRADVMKFQAGFPSRPVDHDAYVRPYCRA